MPEASLPDIQVHEEPESGEEKRREAYCLTASICLLRMKGGGGGVAISMASDHRARAKWEEATLSPRSCKSRESRNLVASLKCVHVMLSLRILGVEGGVYQLIPKAQ